jgi:hypothetical protein
VVDPRQCVFKSPGHAHLFAQVASEQIEMMLQLLDPVGEPAIVLERDTEGTANGRGYFGRSNRRVLRGCLWPYVGRIGFHAAAPCSLLNECHPRPVNAYRLQ